MTEVKVNAMVSELIAQRNWALERVTAFAMEIALLRAENAELRKNAKAPEPTSS